MGKKKKSVDDVLYEFDKSIDQKYVGLLEEIQFMQADLKRAEKKARKQAMKNMKKGNDFYPMNLELRVREHAIHQMEGTDFFTRVTKAIEDLRPICIAIARLVMALIVSILSIDAIKYRIRPETLDKMNGVYTFAKKVVTV